MISIDDYNRAEALARITAPYPAIRAFTPTTFLRDGTPTYATCEAELARYVDMMGEVHAFQGWDKALFSNPEIGDIFWLRNQVEILTEKLFGTRITPVSNLLSPWPILRTVRHLSQGRPLRIFEIAAGCGYLGAYLLHDGHEYYGSDVTQGLYLWQDRLWSSLRDSEYVRVHHIPWWVFAIPEFGHWDVVICDSALGEMNWFGYEYTLRAAKKMIGDTGYFLFSNIGDNVHRHLNTVKADLLKLNLYKLYESPQGVQVWSKGGAALTRMPLPSGTPLSELNLIPDPLPPNYAWLRFAGLC